MFHEVLLFHQQVELCVRHNQFNKITDVPAAKRLVSGTSVLNGAVQRLTRGA
jgi:hypothetical protein